MERFYSVGRLVRDYEVAGVNSNTDDPNGTIKHIELR